MQRLFPFLCILFLSFQGLGAQQYWKDFFFFNDPQGFDNPPYYAMELSLDEAQSIGTYTEVLVGQSGLEEALSYIHNDPEYLYRYHYNQQGEPLIRLSYYVDDFMALSPLDELFYYYDDQGLFAVSLYEYSLFDPNVKSRQFTKVRHGGNMRYYNDFELSRNEDLVEYLVELETQLLEELPPINSLLLGIIQE